MSCSTATGTNHGILVLVEMTSHRLTVPPGRLGSFATQSAFGEKSEAFWKAITVDDPAEDER